MSRFGAILLILSPLALMPAGCPTAGDSGSSSVPDDVFVQVIAPDSAAKGTTVTLSAALSADVSGAAFRWFQTFGRSVTLQNATSADASFVTPAVKDATTIGFRVDALRSGSVFSSAEIRVNIEADPNFGLDDSADGDGSETDPFPRVRLTTSMGVIVVELNRDKAPLSVNNFLRYVDDGYYDGTIFHRVIPDFVVQGGGFEPGLEQKRARSPILNESSNGLLNDRGTIAMARTNDVNSATSQFYFNLKDNTDLNRRDADNFAGYCVFGKVVQGLSVVDEIAAVETGSQNGFDDVPFDDVILEKAERFTGVITPDTSDDDKDSDDGRDGSGGSSLDGSGSGR